MREYVEPMKAGKKKIRKAAKKRRRNRSS